MPLIEEPTYWRVLIVPALLGLAIGVGAIVARSAWPLLWAAFALCGEEALALEIGRRPAQGWAVAFAVLLFVGLDVAHLASGPPTARQPLSLYAKSLLPIYVVAAAVALLLALLSRSVSVSGLGLILIGLGGAAALITVLAALVLAVRGSDRG